jgi:hypothetical protein
MPELRFDGRVAMVTGAGAACQRNLGSIPWLAPR